MDEADACSQCDLCGKKLTLNKATCVANASEHLHACSPACVLALEVRLGTG